MLYRTSTPTRSKVFNLTILRMLSKLRDRIIGVFYLQSIRDVVPIVDSPHELPKPFFYPVTEDDLASAVEMTCIRCGACCEVHAGAFAFEDELREIERFLGRAIAVEQCEYVKLLTGEVAKVCTIASNKCPFYDERRRLCGIYSVRPIACRIHFCTLVGKKGGKLCVKVRGPNGEPLYLEWREDLEDLARLVRSFVLKLARHSTLNTV